MQDLANFFLEVSKRVNANGGAIPQELLDALSQEKMNKSEPDEAEQTTDPRILLADKLVRKHLFFQY